MVERTYKEGKAVLSEVEPVVLDEDHAERLDKDVDDTVGQGDVQVEGDDDGLSEAEDEGSNQGDVGDFADGHVLHLDLALRLELWVSRHPADSRRTAVENAAGRVSQGYHLRNGTRYSRRVTRLWQEERQERKTTARHPKQDPDGPRPALGLCNETADDGTHNGTGRACETPQADGHRPPLGRPYIRAARTARRQCGRAHEAGEEAEREERAEVLRERCRDLKRDEDGEGDDVDGRAAELRDLAERAEEHGPDAVANDEHRQAERRCRL